MILEVIATTLTDAVLAEQGGADRIELITGFAEGGLTPSQGLIEAVVGSVHIPVQVMIRPHSQSFTYNEADFRTMLTDIRVVKKAGARGIVIGALTEAHRIDVDIMHRLLAEAEGMDVTFHRAFDEVEDQVEALGLLSQFPQIRRVLTSGGTAPAPQAMPQIKRLVEASLQYGIEILAGYGLAREGLEAFIEHTGVREVHFGSAVRENGKSTAPVDVERVAAIQQVLKSYHR
ncbi:copper homeostasis protein [Paenibacillus selenitireducens]|uniref:PF03932 family protein CutC n=1 Tax=Paenibacillus selenitireducens TaxID=1324314 RepID=A0A1T2XLN7_9BACL|nr:copper homeostasis protein CutC [Paenibacillus selenitireducens]OPA80800.1 copper homeostasis protein [Paenibacillus selenitireducens]